MFLIFFTTNFYRRLRTDSLETLPNDVASSATEVVLSASLIYYTVLYIYYEIVHKYKKRKWP